MRYSLIMNIFFFKFGSSNY